MRSAMGAASQLPGRRGGTNVDDAPEFCMLIKNLMMRMNLRNPLYFPCFVYASSKDCYLCRLVRTMEACLQDKYQTLICLPVLIFYITIFCVIHHINI